MMQLDALLEVSAGIVLTWLILSIATSQVQEIIIEIVGWRAKFLEARLYEMLKSDNLMKQFYNHPLIQALNTGTLMGRERKPVNIPNAVFAQAVVDIFMNAGNEKDDKEITPAESMSVDEMSTNLANCTSYLEGQAESLARTVKHLVPNIETDLTAITDNVAEQKKVLTDKLTEYRGNVSQWFDNTMRQATYIYRKYAAILALAIGIILASIFNVDSIHIVNHLWRDPTLRQAIIAHADNVNPGESASFDATIAQLNELSLPVGWNTKSTPQDTKGWVLKGFGIFLTGIAAAQGAPFWFDILRKITGFKSEVTKEEKT